MSCKAICRKNKTEKGYLCDETNNPTFTFNKKKWCRINNVDVKNYEKYLGKPNTQMNIYGNYFWDYIAEENNPQSMCLSNGKITYSLPCLYKNTFNYLYFGVICTTLLKNVEAEIANIMTEILPKTFKHFQETIELSNKSDGEILLFLLNKLRNLCQTNLVDQGILSQEVVNKNIKILEDRIKETSDNEIENGKFLKEIFRTASEIIKTNEKYNASLYPTSLIDFFIEKIPDQYAMRIIKGANFIQPDHGGLYLWAKTNIKTNYARFSTHESSEDQYAFTNMFVDSYLHMVCGVIEKEGVKYTWCQFEGAPMNAGLSTPEVYLRMFHGLNIDKNELQIYLDHAADTVYYLYTGLVSKFLGKQPLNIAIGTSKYKLETTPLEIENLDLGLVLDDPIFEELKGIKTSSISSFINVLTNKLGLNFEYIKNAFTYNLGIHDDLSVKYNLTVDTQTISPFERDRQNTLNYTDNLNIGQGINSTPNMYIPSTSLLYAQPTLAIGRGGKHKKRTRKIRTTNKKRINKIKSCKHIK